MLFPTGKNLIAILCIDLFASIPGGGIAEVRCGKTIDGRTASALTTRVVHLQTPLPERPHSVAIQIEHGRQPSRKDVRLPVPTRPLGRRPRSRHPPVT